MKDAVPTRQETLLDSNSSVQLPSIVVFGREGVGKSSLINLMAGRALAPIENSVGRFPFDSREHCIELQCDNTRQEYRVWEIQGLGDSTKSPLPQEAIRNLQEVMKQLVAGPGVALLVYCVWAGRQSRALGDNLELFQNVIFQPDIPFIIVVTGLEEEEDTERWWRANESVLDQFGLPPTKFPHVCVTTTRGKPLPQAEGKGHVYDKEYEASREKVLQLMNVSQKKKYWRPPQDYERTIDGRVEAFVASIRGRDTKTRRQSRGGAASSSWRVSLKRFFFACFSGP